MGDTERAEWLWIGTKDDGTPLEERGVTMLGIRGGQIAWARLYLEEPNGKGPASSRPLIAWPVAKIRRAKNQRSRAQAKGSHAQSSPRA